MAKTKACNNFKACFNLVVGNTIYIRRSKPTAAVELPLKNCIVKYWFLEVRNFKSLNSDKYYNQFQSKSIHKLYSNGFSTLKEAFLIIMNFSINMYLKKEAKDLPPKLNLHNNFTENFIHLRFYFFITNQWTR